MRIWLVRHGESLGNLHPSAWSKISDQSIPLTEFGIDQGQHAGEKIRQFYQDRADLKDKKIRVWYSPFLRTKQTKNALAKGLGDDLIGNRNSKGEPGWEDDRLVEQDFGMFSPLYTKEQQFKHFPLQAERFYAIRDDDYQGKYWAKAPDGENRAHVCARVGDFIKTMMRDKEKGKEDVVVVTHGVTMRAFEKRFVHHDIEWFEKEPNPGNCDVVLIEGDETKGYTVTPMFKGLKREAALPKDYKTMPVGGWEILKERFKFDQPGTAPVRPQLEHPRIAAGDATLPTHLL